MQRGQKSRLGHPTSVYQSSWPETGSGRGQPGIPFASMSSASCLVGGTPFKEVLRWASGRAGLENVGDRASIGDVLANEWRAGNPGLELLGPGMLKLLVEGDPARESVIDSCCRGISKDACLGPNAGNARSEGRGELGVPDSSYIGYGSPAERGAAELNRGTSGAESMRIDADRRDGGLVVAVLGRPEVAAIRELQSRSFGGIGGI